MTSVNSNNLNLKYQRFTSSGCRDIGIRKLGFVAKTQFLSLNIYFLQFIILRIFINMINHLYSMGYETTKYVLSQRVKALLFEILLGFFYFSCDMSQ